MKSKSSKKQQVVTSIFPPTTNVNIQIVKKRKLYGNMIEFRMGMILKDEPIDLS